MLVRRIKVKKKMSGTMMTSASRVVGLEEFTQRKKERKREIEE